MQLYSVNIYLLLAVVKTTVFLADMNDYPEVNKAYAECKLLHTCTVPPPPVANSYVAS